MARIRKLPRRLIGPGLIGLAAIAPGCTDAQLCKLPCAGVELPPPDNQLTVTGQVCTLAPEAVVYPYKILFVIDVSGSNELSDPQDARAAAVQRVIDTYIDNPSVSFGVISFNDNPEKQTPGFTRNYDVLVPDVMTSLTVKEDNTNYLATLELAYEMIEEDILASPEGERARTRYDVQWLSDGIPDPCQRPGPVQEMTRRLVELRDKYGLFDLVINTTQLVFPGGTYDVDGCNDVLPGPDYLSPMADIGLGSFQVLEDADLAFNIGFTEILRAFENRQFFVTNESRIVWQDELLADSDRDGIADEDATHEPDPLLADANFDGCTDRVDMEMRPNVNLCADTCLREMQTAGPDRLQDLDNDGLPDCAERVLGYFRTRADSDLDGFSDVVELKAGTNPLEPDPFSEDRDGDGVWDGDEIISGTNPRWPESPEARQDLAYRYRPMYPVPNAPPGMNCFEFGVDNVQLVYTQPLDGGMDGDNLICVYMVQTPLDSPSAEPFVTRSCKMARYVRRSNYDFIEPPTGVLTFSPEDFRMAEKMPQIAPNPAAQGASRSEGS